MSTRFRAFLPCFRARSAFAAGIAGPIILAGMWWARVLIKPDHLSPNRDGDLGSGVELVARPRRIDLGELRPGVVRTAAVELDNRGDEAAVVVGVRSSCPCISVAPNSLRVAPKGVGRLSIKFDPSEEPGFRGRLAVVVEGVAEGGLVVFTLPVDISVLDEPGFAGVKPGNHEEVRP